MSLIKIKGKSKESLRFVIDLKEMKSKTYVATVLGFKVKVLIFFWGEGRGGGGVEKGALSILFVLLLCGTEVQSRLS